MAYLLCKEMGRLTLFHYFLSTDGGFYIATNNALKFPTKKQAQAHGKALLKKDPSQILYTLGPRKGMTRIK